ncbi:MAG: amidohydrolase [Proteobacteria bacterium]|nr:amidohydrolase [Pseudomonadota bacterium]
MRKPADLLVFDADNHLYETPDSLTRYLPREHRKAIEYVQVRGRTKVAVRGTITDYIPNPTFDPVAAPGCHARFYQGDNPRGLTRRDMSVPVSPLPGWREPEPRLALMDEQGLDRAFMYPSVANLVEKRTQDDPELTHAVMHALNEWMAEVWSFDYRGRIFPTPVITLPIVERAIEELDWVLERGARAVIMRPAPAVTLRGSRSIGLPEFDPFWARAQEAGVVVVLHGTDSVVTEYVDLWEPPRTDNAYAGSAFREVVSAHRDVSDCIASLICHGTLSRFPRLKIASVENGADWVAPLLRGLKLVHGRIPQDFAEDPVEVFRRNVWVSPFWETDIVELIGLIGAGQVLFGSDYPHPECIPEPLSYLDELAGLDDATVRQIMGGNASRMLGLRE